MAIRSFRQTIAFLAAASDTNGAIGVVELAGPTRVRASPHVHQLAKQMGAEVTAVRSGANVDLAGSLGADHVVAYTAEDFARSGQRYDVIMDNHGNAPYARVKGSLRPGGRFLMVIGDLRQMLAATRQAAVISGNDNDDPFRGETYEELMSLVERGGLRPVIDAVMPFGEIVAAHRRVDSGHKVGSLVLTFDGD